MATTKITNPELFDLGSLDTALKLPSGTTAERPTSPSTGEWRYNTTTNLVEFYDGGDWRVLQSEDIPPIPSENFSAVLYTGTGSAQSITGVGFQPDMVWIKDRIQAYAHNITDTTRGTSKQIFPPYTNAQDTTYTNRVTSFDADGFTIGNDNYVNTNGNTFVAWCWKANGGTTTAGSGTNTTSVTNQVNTKAGFSISTFTGSASAAGNFTHGLGEVPDMYIVKTTSFSDSWFVWHKDLTNTTDYAVRLNTSAAEQSLSGFWNSTAPSSTLISLGNGILVNNATYVAYAFKSVAGYSSFGTYTGNGSTNGPIVNTGFEPAFVMFKRTDSADNWILLDNKRSTSNPRINALFPNLDAVELTSGFSTDFLTNGFQLKTSDNSMNSNGGTYIYMAFAADQSAAPVLADSFNNSLWTGNGTSQSITGVGFQPSLTWIKSRNITYDHALTDIIRGTSNPIYLTTGTQFSNSTFITSFDTDGFSIGNNAVVNNNTNTYVGWNWKANPTPTINTDGTIQSLVSANPAAGFSIVKVNGNNGNVYTFGHGLDVAPSVVFLKGITFADNWMVYTSTTTANAFLSLNQSAASNTNSTIFNNTEPTDKVFTVGTNSVINNGTNPIIAYCFHSVAGYSKIGSYTGNGTAGHAITGLGFQPNFILIKGITSADNWFIYDSARGDSVTLNPNLNAAEYADTGVTSFDSDGFTLGSAAGENRNGDTYIYMAFKNNPAVLPIASGEMAFLVVAGGGSGGARDAGPAGAGGLRTSYGSTSGGGASAENDITLAAGTYTITVGSGGAAIINANAVTPGNSGTDSSISATGLTTITSIAGGGGGTATQAASSGGSGGGGTAGQQPGSGTSGQGFAGGAGTGSYTSGGGGGAGQTGNTPPSNENGGDGGNGLAVTITGSTISYAGGGGGSGDTSSGAGGRGGGGAGSSDAAVNATSGTPNTGGGGGSHRQNSGTSGAGGSGVAILRMNTTDYSGVTTGSPTVTTDGSYTILTYTGSGTYVHS